MLGPAASYELHPAAFFIAAGLGVVVGLIARSKGRNFFGWWVFGFLLFIVAIIVVLIIPSTKDRPAAVGPSNWQPAVPPPAIPPPPVDTSPPPPPPPPPAAGPNDPTTSL
jgi:cell division protein FtsW (lipid II flippase)